MSSIEQKRIEDIKPYEKNAKLHPKKQVQQIANSIKAFGFNQAIVTDMKGVIIVGHGRFEAAKLLGMETVPVISLKLTDKKAKAYRLADNRLNQSDWDMKLVIEELKDLADEELVELTGFEKDILLSDEERDAAVPDVPVKAQSVLGDLYELGSHRVMCGDSTSLQTIEKLMAGKKADCIWTDPPYNVNYGATMKDKLRGTSNRKILNDSFKNTVAFYQFLFDALTAMRPHVRGDVYIAMSSSELHTLQKAFTDCGGHWSTFIIWVKNTFTIGRANYQRQYEPILYGWFEGSSHYWSGRRNLGDIVRDSLREDADGSKWIKVHEDGGVASDIWEFPKPSKNREHPTMKPVPLVTRAIVNSSLPGNIVLDSFGGGGSTLIACEKAGRSCFTCELDPKYVDVIVQRYVDYTGNNQVIKNGKKITWGHSQKGKEKIGI